MFSLKVVGRSCRSLPFVFTQSTPEDNATRKMKISMSVNFKINSGILFQLNFFSNAYIGHTVRFHLFFRYSDLLNQLDTMCRFNF